jgi:tetratricopeptide (TPR) repeat protein
LRAYIEQWPQDDNVPEARYLLAISLRELKRPQEAFAATLDLLRTEKSRVATDPKRWAYWQRKTGNQLANDFFETGDTMNARAIYAGLLELSTERGWRVPISYQLALCYERLGATDNARTSYQSVVDGAGENPPADLLELATMAKWRIQHLAWRESVTQQISTFFDSNGSSSNSPSIGSPTLSKTAATP